MNKLSNQSKKIKPIYAFLIIALALLIIFFSITQNKFFKVVPPQEKKLSIVVTIFPFFSLAKELVPEDIEISWLTFGKDAHSFTPQPQDLEKLKEASMVVYSSEAMSPWINKVEKNLSSEILLVNLSESLEGKLMATEHHDEHDEEHHGKDIDEEHHDHDEHDEEHHSKDIDEEHHDHDEHDEEHHSKDIDEEHHDHDEHDEEHHDKDIDEEHHDHDEHHEEHHDKDIDEEHHDHDEHHHEHGDFDPHFWLNFSLTSKTVDYLSANLTKILPEQKEIIEAQKKILQEKLLALDEKYKTTLASCSRRDFYVLGHNAFNYLAERYNLQYIPFINNLSSQAEPRLQSFMEIISKIEKEKIKYVFYEKSEKSDKNLSLMENTKIALLPLSNGSVLTQEQIKEEANYFDLMESNLINLKKGLDCQ